MKYIFLAEKPSAMKAIKEAYNNSDKPLGQIDFFALAGHICQLCEPKDYEEWNVKWDERKLPMVPSPFKVKMLTENKVIELKKVLEKGNYDAIIVGTDSDVEGNGIYDLIETYLGLESYKTYRFFETDLTPKGIMDSMSKLTDYHSNPRDIGMTQAYRIRSRFDWLVGFNMTVAYTRKSGFLMKVGRVKAPTLKLVYDNCNAIDNFKSNKTYQPYIVIDDNVTAYMIDDDSKAVAFSEKSDAEKICSQLSKTAVVDSFEKSIKKTRPNQLFKLTDIQYEAGVKFGYTPERTLELIQSLYEKHKLISYPRTDGRYVSTEKAKDFPRLLAAVKAMPEFANFNITDEDVKRAQSDKRYVNDAEVQKSSHDALIPTGEFDAITQLNVDERNICEMIFRRFLAIFLLDLEEEKSKSVLSDNGFKFVCNGSRVISPGYSVLYETPKDNLLPEMKRGDKMSEKESGVHEVITKPPARLSQASLIKAMENIQKYMGEADLKQAMKKAGGIGQPSSRAAIISELISTGYMEDVKSGKGKGLHMTPMGITYIKNLGTSSIVKPELSAEWELHMDDLRNGKAEYDKLYTNILDYLQKALDETEHMQISKMVKDKVQVGVCPKCGKSVYEYNKAYVCGGYPDCDFAVFKNIAGKQLNNSAIKELLEDKQTGMMGGFKSKTGKPFAAILAFDEDYKLRFIFEKKTDMSCPKCGAAIIQTSMSYKCEKCDFVLWKQISGKILTEKNVKDLLSGNHTDEIKGFKSKDGKMFNAKLVIKDNKLEWVFNKPKDTGLKCPKCGRPILEYDNAYICENRPDCDFHIFKAIAGKTLKLDHIKSLLLNRKTEPITGFKSKSGGEFTASLIFDNEYNVKFEFSQDNNGNRRKKIKKNYKKNS